MKKKLSIITGFCLIISFVSYSQGLEMKEKLRASPISALLFKANILPTGISIEKGVLNSTSFEFSTGITYDGAFEPQNIGSPLFIWGNPYINLKLNQYIGRGRMESLGRPVFNNAGNYLSLDYQFTFPPVVHINKAAGITSKVNNPRVGILYGSKKNLGQHFQMGSETGLGVVINQGILIPVYILRFSIGYVLMDL